MKILVDADSCPKPARELLLRRAKKLGIRIIFAANRAIPGANTGGDIANSVSGAEMEICSTADNSADDRIVELAEKGDLAVTRDIPLAKRLVEKEVTTLDDRGRIFTKENINELLSIRNFMVGLADNGLEYERTANYGKKDLKKFADSLEKLLRGKT
ncbi:MAG: DUF188 domain-containing protein [Treponema sp.]|nr:DUF188 domain-containing protein [Treponema sp.]